MPLERLCNRRRNPRISRMNANFSGDGCVSCEAQQPVPGARLWRENDTGWDPTSGDQCPATKVAGQQNAKPARSRLEGRGPCWCVVHT